LGLSLLLACAVGSIGGPSRADDNEITWLGDFREAVKAARASHKPILVEFRCEA
jgi:hypothetical protein